MSMEIYTSYWRRPGLAEVDAQMVSISRGDGRGVAFGYRKLWDLAPNNETWSYDDTEAFTRSYLQQLAVLGANHVLAELERVSGERPVVLLCHERPHEEFCHRWLLASWIQERTGVVVPELAPGMLPDAAGVAQPRLL